MWLTARLSRLRQRVCCRTILLWGSVGRFSYAASLSSSTVWQTIWFTMVGAALSFLIRQSYAVAACRSCVADYLNSVPPMGTYRVALLGGQKTLRIPVHQDEIDLGMRNAHRLQNVCGRLMHALGGGAQHHPVALSVH